MTATKLDPERLKPVHRMRGAKRFAYLERQKTIRVATTDKDGVIYLTPLWFVLHDKRIFLPLDAGSKHASNSLAGGALSAVVDSGDEYATVHGIRMSGTLKPLDTPELVDQLMALVFEKYFYEGHPYAEAYFGFGRPAGRTIYELVPDKMIGWDMREISVPAMPEARDLPDFVVDRRLPD